MRDPSPAVRGVRCECDERTQPPSARATPNEGVARFSLPPWLIVADADDVRANAAATPGGKAARSSGQPTSSSTTTLEGGACTLVDLCAADKKKVSRMIAKVRAKRVPNDTIRFQSRATTTTTDATTIATRWWS